tara:strand:- start:254 stop:469 length:216 start_codon:yes stop_codon:yes gene_type:complete
MYKVNLVLEHLSLDVLNQLLVDLDHKIMEDAVNDTLSKEQLNEVVGTRALVDTQVFIKTMQEDCEEVDLPF